MHGRNLSCFFRIVGSCYRTANSRTRTHIIYIGIVLSKKIIIILKKVAEKFGGLKNMLYLCSRK